MGYYRKKLSFAERLDDAFGQRVANAGLGVVFSRTGRKRFALKYYQKAIELAERTGDRGGYAKALMDMGTLHRKCL
jgi:tetratricopeptide (TPR) repeat protein